MGHSPPSKPKEGLPFPAVYGLSPLPIGPHKGRSRSDAPPRPTLPDAAPSKVGRVARLLPKALPRDPLVPRPRGRLRSALPPQKRRRRRIEGARQRLCPRKRSRPLPPPAARARGFSQPARRASGQGPRRGRLPSGSKEPSSAGAWRTGLRRCQVEVGGVARRQAGRRPRLLRLPASPAKLASRRRTARLCSALRQRQRGRAASPRCAQLPGLAPPHLPWPLAGSASTGRLLGADSATTSASRPPVPGTRAASPTAAALEQTRARASVRIVGRETAPRATGRVGSRAD